MQTMVTVQVQDMNDMKASKLAAVDNLKGVDVISTKEVHTACGNEQKQYSNEAFVAQPVITANAEDAASAPRVAPVAPVAPTLSQRLFKAAKKSKAAQTKETFAVLCFDRGDGDEEVVEVKEGGCKRLLSVCKGVTKEKLMSGRLDCSAVASIKACVDRILGKAGKESIAGISCDVGYLWLKHQRTLRQALPKFPVLTTPMMQLPFIWTCFGNEKTLLVTWKDEALCEALCETDSESSESHHLGHLGFLETAGIRLDTDRVEILTLSTSDLEWSPFLSGMTTPSENEQLLNQLVNMVQQKVIQLLDKDGVKGVGVNSVVLDSMLSPFGKELSAATNLPVFDEVSMLKLFSSASSLSHFSDASVLCRLDEKSQSQRSKIDGTRMGLVRLEHEYPYGVGDIDHGSTFRFQSCPGVVQGLTFEEAQRGSKDPVILENLKRVVDKMEAEECFGIAGNCGFMHFYQEFVRDYATVPVFMSALVQVPTMAAALEPDERILILTANESSFMESRDALLSAEGRPFCDFNRVLVRGCEHVPGFEAVANADLVDNIKVQENLGEYVKEILEQEKESDKGPIKSILLECTQMPHYAAAIRQSTGLPVFDVVTCVNFFASSLCHPLPKAQVLNGVNGDAKKCDHDRQCPTDVEHQRKG